ncbi:hypothetical protein HYC85_028567, partial [Camellia sinensis]
FKLPQEAKTKSSKGSSFLKKLKQEVQKVQTPLKKRSRPGKVANRPTKLADRPQNVPTNHQQCRPAITSGRWQGSKAGGLKPWPVRFKTVTGVRTVVAKNYNLRPRAQNGVSGGLQFLDTVFAICYSRTYSIIASKEAIFPKALWVRGRRLYRSEDLVDGQIVFFSLPPVTRRRSVRHSSSVQRLLDQRSLSTPPVSSQAEVSISTAERDTHVVQLDQHLMAGMEEMMRQLQETMQAIQRMLPAKQRVPILGDAAYIQENTDVPTGPVPPPIQPQLSKAPANLVDTPLEFEVDPIALKVSKLEKLFEKAQGVNFIPDIKDGYTDSAMTLPNRFKMPHIDRFDGSGDLMVHLRLFSDILRPMGLSKLQKLSLFGRTLSGVAVIWYAKLEDSVKSWEEMAEAFIAQYSYNTQIEVTTRDLETTRQEPKESFSDFVTRWKTKASMMTTRPIEKDQI